MVYGGDGATTGAELDNHPFRDWPSGLGPVVPRWRCFGFDRIWRLPSRNEANSGSAAIPPGRHRHGHARTAFCFQQGFRHCSPVHVRSHNQGCDAPSCPSRDRGLFGLFTLPKFDYFALASYIRASCEEKGGRPDGRWWFWTAGRCSRQGIAVMLEPNGALLVPDFAFRRQQWTIFDWALTLIFGLFALLIASMCSLLLFLTMLTWSLLMIGGAPVAIATESREPVVCP